MKSSQSSMEIKHLITLATEIFTKLNDINPNFMKEIFYLFSQGTHKKCDDLFIFVMQQNMPIIL